MALRIKPLDLSQVQTGSVRRRPWRLSVEDLAGVPEATAPLQAFYATLPKIGEAANLIDAAELIAQTALAGKPIVWVVDGAFIDCGLSAMLAQLMRRGLVQALALNGEAAVRDYELAFHGVTSEDSAAGLADGLLGLARETAEGINAIVNDGVKRGFAIGECLGRGILDRQPRNYTSSIMATGAARLTPTSVHVSVGADGFHRYPGADGAMLGKGSLKDSFLLSSFLTSMPAGGLIIATHRDHTLNQVFLHAYALARNLNDQLGGLNVIRLGAEVPALDCLPGLQHHLQVGGAPELIFPLLTGALFSIVE